MHRRGRPRRRRSRYHEEYAYVLDYLPMGNPSDRHPWHRNKPVVQLIGEDYFMLMEASPRPMAQLEIGERVYVGPISEMRVKIAKVDSDIEYEDLTPMARSMLPSIVEQIVRSKEPVFVEFFNIAEPINIRLHTLSLLPGVGKKTLQKILEERSRKPFESFEDIKQRTHIDPVKALVERILEELKGGQKYYLFVLPPRREREQPVKPIFFNYLGRIYEKLGEKARVRTSHAAGGEEGGGAEA